MKVLLCAIPLLLAGGERSSVRTDGVVYVFEVTDHLTSETYASSITTDGSNLKWETTGTARPVTVVYRGGPEQTLFVADHTNLEYWEFVSGTSGAQAVAQTAGEADESVSTRDVVSERASMDAPTAFPSGAHVQILGLLRAHGVWNGAPEGGTGSRSALRPTDERMEILGLPAVKHEEIVDVRVVREVWLVDWPAVTGETAMRTVLADIDAFLTDGRAASLSPELAQLTQSFRIDFPVRSTRFDRMYEEMKEIAGSVLEPVDTSTLGLRIRVESEATEVRKGPIPAGTFDPPAGYKKKRDP